MKENHDFSTEGKMWNMRKSYVVKLAVAIVFFSVICVIAEDTINVTVPGIGEIPKLIPEDAFAANGPTGTTAPTVRAIFFDHTSGWEKRSEVFRGTAPATDMTKSWTGSWHYNDDAKGRWDEDVDYMFWVENMGEGESDHTTRPFGVIPGP